MDIEFDATKEKANIAKHRISLRAAIALLSSYHLVELDDRFAYGEERLRATGEIGDRVHVCVYTPRGDVYRIISLRRANRRETDAYYKNKPGRG
jgi:uncharacterized DUF497 family protein